MKPTIAEPTLNCLGWLAEKGTSFDRGQTIKGMIGHFGVRAAIRKGFLAIGTYRVPTPPPGMPRSPYMPHFGITYSGYVLTDLGKRLGEIGVRYRASPWPPHDFTPESRANRVRKRAAPFLAEAEALLQAEAHADA